MQGQCGSCWAFSTAGLLEGQHFRKTGRAVSLSEQQLVDCRTNEPYNNGGCFRGFMTKAFEYIRDNGGLDSERCYPYTAMQGTCQYRQSCVKATVTGYTVIPEGSEESLKKAVASVGPVSVAIDASQQSFQLYK